MILPPDPGYSCWSRKEGGASFTLGYKPVVVTASSTDPPGRATSPYE